MIFASPWLLLALAVLPVLWWLLRVTPPAPRTENFPAIRLLLGLRAAEETPARTPWWLLALRLLAAALVIVGLAQPVLDAGGGLPGSGPLLLVLDDGWAASGDWSTALRAAGEVLDRAERAHRPVALLATAPDETGAKPALSATMPAAELRPVVAALHPRPWPVDRAAAAAALAAWHAPGAAVAYVADGLAAPGDDAFARALAAVGPVEEWRPDPPRAMVLLPPRSEADRLVARVGALRAAPAAIRRGAGAERRRPHPGALRIHHPGRPATAPRRPSCCRPSSATGSSAWCWTAPPRPAASRCWTSAGAGGRSGCWRPDASADAPLTGSLYYLRRALAPYVELREGNLSTLLSRDLSVIVLADQPLVPGEDSTEALTSWVEKGGLLVRFAGPRMAEAGTGAGGGHQPAAPDPLLPVQLLGGDRQLGGALSWSHPEHLAAIPAGIALRRPRHSRRRDHLAPGPGRTLRRTQRPHLGAARRRHAAGDRGAARRRVASCCSTSPPMPTGRTCRCPACSSTCCAGWCSSRWASPPFPTRRRWRPRPRSTGSAPSAPRRRPPCRWPPTSSPRRWSRRSIRPASTDRRTGGGRSISRPTCRRCAWPRRCRGRRSPRSALSRASGRSGPGCSARRSPCSASTCCWRSACAACSRWRGRRRSRSCSRSRLPGAGRPGARRGCRAGGAAHAARLCADRRRPGGPGLARRARRPLQLRQRPHRGDAGAARRRGAGRGRSLRLSAALLADHPGRAVLRARDRGAQRLHAQWRHHPDRHPRRRRRDHHPRQRRRAPPRRARARRAAARAAHQRPRAGPRLLPAERLPRPLHRRPGLGAARPGPHQ